MKRLHQILVTASAVLAIGCATPRAQAEPADTSPAPQPACSLASSS